MKLHLIDVAAIVLYLLGITWFGLRFRNGERSLRSYFLADRNVPWWAISLSIVSAETSTLTIISIPGLAYTGDFGFLQIAIGYLLGRIVVCVLFLPRYFEGQLMTAYQLIGERFGKALHRFTAGIFLATRAAAEGVRIFAVSIVITVAFGTGTDPVHPDPHHPHSDLYLRGRFRRCDLDGRRSRCCSTSSAPSSRSGR